MTLRPVTRNHHVRKSYEILVAENDKQLQRYGKSVQLSLFQPVYDRDYNDLERRFAFYLDEQKALQLVAPRRRQAARRILPPWAGAANVSGPTS